MTKEEAIKILKEIEYPANGDNWEYREMAFDMAIKALSVEPCEDCISRQAALDKAVYTETEEGWSGRTVDVKDIEALPPVTPKQKMGRLIKVVTEADYLGNETYHYECSECGFKSFFGTERYCQNCGAKMAESEDNE